MRGARFTCETGGPGRVAAILDQGTHKVRHKNRYPFAIHSLALFLLRI